MRWAIILALLFWFGLYAVVATVSADPLSQYSPDSHSYFGTLGDASTFLGRYGYECKITNTGKLEGKGDQSNLPTWDISTDSDSKRVKYGCGSDTSTDHGGRYMCHGNDFLLSPGSVVIQSGRTSAVGADGKGAFVGIYTSTKQPIVFGIDDRPFIELGADRVIVYHEKLKRFKDGSLGVPLRVDGRVYYLELRK